MPCGKTGSYCQVHIQKDMRETLETVKLYKIVLYPLDIQVVTKSIWDGTHSVGWKGSVAT